MGRIQERYLRTDIQERFPHIDRFQTALWHHDKLSENMLEQCHSAQACELSRMGDLKGLQKLGKGCAALHQADEFGNTPALYAAMHGHAKVVTWLAKTIQVDLAARNVIGSSPLHMAAAAG